MRMDPNKARIMPWLKNRERDITGIELSELDVITSFRTEWLNLTNWLRDYECFGLFDDVTPVGKIMEILDIQRDIFDKMIAGGINDRRKLIRAKIEFSTISIFLIKWEYLKDRLFFKVNDEQTTMAEVFNTLNIAEINIRKQTRKEALEQARLN